MKKYTGDKELIKVCLIFSNQFFTQFISLFILLNLGQSESETWLSSKMSRDMRFQQFGM